MTNTGGELQEDLEVLDYLASADLMLIPLSFPDRTGLVIEKLTGKSGPRHLISPAGQDLMLAAGDLRKTCSVPCPTRLVSTSQGIDNLFVTMPDGSRKHLQVSSQPVEDVQGTVRRSFFPFQNYLSRWEFARNKDGHTRSNDPSFWADAREHLELSPTRINLPLNFIHSALKGVTINLDCEVGDNYLCSTRGSGSYYDCIYLFPFGPEKMNCAGKDVVFGPVRATEIVMERLPIYIFQSREDFEATFTIEERTMSVVPFVMYDVVSRHYAAKLAQAERNGRQIH